MQMPQTRGELIRRYGNYERGIAAMLRQRGGEFRDGEAVVAELAGNRVAERRVAPAALAPAGPAPKPKAARKARKRLDERARWISSDLS